MHACPFLTYGKNNFVVRRCVKSRDNFVLKLLIGPVWFKDFYIRIDYKLQVIGEKVIGKYQHLKKIKERFLKFVTMQCKCKYPYLEHSLSTLVWSKHGSERGWAIIIRYRKFEKKIDFKKWILCVIGYVRLFYIMSPSVISRRWYNICKLIRDQFGTFAVLGSYWGYI